jgi:phosphohistidine phosphatase
VTILTTLRHAKSSWGDAQLDDFDRPLNDRGRKAAKAIGRELSHRRVRFDLVIASPALRVRETLEEVERGYGKALNIHFDPQIYGARVETIFDLVRSLPNTAHAPLLVGHNPTLQQLVLMLAADDDQGLRQRIRTKYPTAGVAIIELPAVRWGEVVPDSGRIRELIVPRELD